MATKDDIKGKLKKNSKLIRLISLKLLLNVNGGFTLAVRKLFQTAEFIDSINEAKFLLKPPKLSLSYVLCSPVCNSLNISPAKKACIHSRGQ
ncbi:hypothetical protein BIV59_04395 [Bacillus sp. MUM 13]|nr:hypothetical protein BIV59_04395 [Bacillus sp. MUM 13]